MTTAAPSLSGFASALPALPATTAVQRLAPGKVLRLSAPRAHLLRIDSGCAWLTFGVGPLDAGSGRAGDVFLCAGQTLRLPGRSRVLIEAARGMELRFAWLRPDAVQRQVLGRAPAGAGAQAASC